MKFYPMPFEFKETGEKFCFGKEMQINFNANFPSEKTIPLMCELWSNFTAGHSTLSFVFDKTLEENSFSTGHISTALKPESEYAISVTKDGIGASAVSATGLIHSICTLLQLIKPEPTDNDGFDRFYINTCEIQDKPSLKFRCFHSAVLRDSLSIVRKTVRLCGLMKYSHILFEFFGTIKLDCMPELAHDDAYTKDEIKPLIEEARAFGMEVVPMFNHMGHAACANNTLGEHVVLSRYPEKSAMFEPDGWVFCLSNPETKRILKAVRKEMIELCGEGSYFHIGGDEAYQLGTCDICSKTPTFKLYADYVNEVAAEMKPLGRRVIMWAETMLNFYEWEGKTDTFGHKYEASEGTGAETYKALDMLDKSVIMNDWQYTIWDEDVKTLEHFLSKGFDTIPASAEEVKNIDALCKSARKYGGMGLMQTVWVKNFAPNVIVRGGTSSWMENIDEIDKEARGRQNFVREYMCMNHRAGELVRKMMPRGEGIFN